MNQVDLTIGIPTYNRSNYIINSVESVLAQKDVNVEVIVCDDASSDNTNELLKPYMSLNSFKYIRNDFNLGPVPNYNKCIEHAHGKYFMILGDDDWISPEYASILIESLSGKDEIFVGKCIAVNSKGVSLYESGDKQYSIDGDDFFKYFLDSNETIQRHAWFMTCALTNTFKEHLGFPNTEAAQHSDNMLLLKMAFGRRVIYNPKAIYYYRVYPESYGNRNVFSVGIASIQFYAYWINNIEPVLIKKLYSEKDLILFRKKLIRQLSDTYLSRVFKYGPKYFLGKVDLLFKFPYKSWLFSTLIKKFITKLLKIFRRGKIIS